MFFDNREHSHWRWTHLRLGPAEPAEAGGEGRPTVNFTYRADGLRARKEVVGGLTIDYVYDGQTVIGEKRSDGKSVWYTPGPNGYISRTIENDSTGQVTDKEWYVYDGLGSCRAMVKPNAQGTDAVIVARCDYDVYGSVRTQSGSSSNKFKYVAGIGHPTDDETGLIYMRARYYDPQTGRFVSEDPAGHGVNWYWYADGNPVTLIDQNQSGKDPVLALGLVATSILIFALVGLMWDDPGGATFFYVMGLFMLAGGSAIMALDLGATPRQAADVFAKVLGPGIGGLGTFAWKAYIKSLGAVTDQLGGTIGPVGVGLAVGVLS